MQHQAVEERDGGIVLGDVVELLQRRWRLHVAGACIGVAAALAFLSTREPVYRAEATLLLEQRSESGSILSDLAALTQAPVAISEMEILRSRSLMEQVVAAPGAGDTPSGDSAEMPRNLGLTTIADDELLRPLARFRPFARSAGALDGDDAVRIHAHYVPAPGERGEREWRVRFPSVDRVEIAEPGFLWLGDAVELDYAPNVPLDLGGATLRLSVEGDPTDRTFRVFYRNAAEAAERVRRNLRVAETDRSSGVIRVTYDDSDPRRAAETVNALCRNYLERNQAHSERRASRTVQFIEEQLAEQTAALRTAEDAVVRYKQGDPQLVDVGQAAQALIEEYSALEARRIDGRIVRATLAEAIELVERGDLAALSRFGPELGDPVIVSYLESIARLTAESNLLERADAGAYKTLLQGHLLALRVEQEGLRVKLGSLRAARERLAGGDTASLGSLATIADAGTADPLLVAYVEQWTELDARVRSLEAEFTDELPDLRTARGERDRMLQSIVGLVAGRIAGIETQLAEYAALDESRQSGLTALPGVEREHIAGAIERLRQQVLAQLGGRLAGLDAHVAHLGSEADALVEEISALPEKERELAEPMRAVLAHGEIVKLLLLRQQEAEISRAATIASAEFIDAAAPPREPNGPSVPIHVVLGLLLGAGAASVVAFVRESRGSAIVTAAELEMATGLSVVGSIPDFRRGRTRVKGAPEHFVALRDDPEGPIAESYRALRSNLKFIIGSSKERRTLAITSCVPGEGKSVTNIDVALSFAMSGKRVLLVDADMRRPSVSRYLRLGPGRGLSDVLRRTHVWRECLVPSLVPNLDVLPSGPVPATPGDLLAGAGARELIREVREAYDLVIFDVPPALAVADIECLAPHIDAVLLLTRSTRMTDAAVRHAVTRLQQVGANLAGAILNAVVARGRSGPDYGYGYGYGYGTGAGEKDRDAA